MTARFEEEKPKRKLELLRRKEEESSVKILSQKYKIPYVDLGTFPVETDAIKIVPEETARRAELVVFQVAGKRLDVAVRNPEKEETRAALRRLEEDHFTFNLYLASKSSLLRAWEIYKKVPVEYEAASGTVQLAPQKIIELQKELTTLGGVGLRIEKGLAGRTTEVLEIILAGALGLEASDVHVEPQKEKVRLRFRLDGLLHDVASLPPKVYNLLLSRIKLISELKLNVHDRAQDGRFTVKTNSTDIEIRTSVLPGPHGENTVLRILNPKALQVPFEELGMQSWIIEIVADELKKPNGMILTTGPTGSGKTTTLYAFLKKIHSPSVKIITIEDPIEYHLVGVEQTQVSPENGYDFANGLRAIVRQDPDVILVGEIRDFETAETAMHAALTGHLVFSTLHTNSAAGTIPRLLDLGVKPAIIAPAINITMAQRLLRKLCVRCRTPVSVGVAEKKKIEAELGRYPKKAPLPKDWKIFKVTPKGCDDCSGIGYKGRIGVFEIILINDVVERLILREPSEFEIKKEAERQDQITMRQDGLLKVLAGITDFEELERVVGTD
ncbi:MAG: type II/IV secretion system protein [Candidatus Sungiibacteriota bacterium]|uniref:Type II/IV secretion system protein n=1 Tax=Candidatus Sungiibacteriota bacterium TaxID=2750080 RepID=A0A7T5RIU5_9BACT|nr:MAG: type II/IV secretion system protein [Candidatus Sungbacteria bacterium]